MAKARPKLPIRLRNKLFDEVRSVCPNPVCTEAGVSVIEIHHRDGDPANNDENNLIALCGSCHTRAEKSLISEADLDLWKKMLLAGHHPRLGRIDQHQAAPAGTGNIGIGINHGTVQSAKKIVNDFRGRKKPALAPAPDSIGAHATERGYLEYLRKRYIKCRLTEQKYGDKRRFSPAQASNVIEKVLGYPPLQAPITAFGTTWPRIYELVCSTLGASRFMRGYRPKTWDEYHAIILGGGKVTDQDA